MEVKNMTQKFIELPEGNEYDLLEKELDSNDLFILSYLKGFDRSKLKAWSKKGLFDITIND
jgi:hypothetical protein